MRPHRWAVHVVTYKRCHTILPKRVSTGLMLKVRQRLGLTGRSLWKRQDNPIQRLGGNIYWELLQRFPDSA